MPQGELGSEDEHVNNTRLTDDRFARIAKNEKLSRPPNTKVKHQHRKRTDTPNETQDMIL